VRRLFGLSRWGRPTLRLSRRPNQPLALIARRRHVELGRRLERLALLPRGALAAAPPVAQVLVLLEVARSDGHQQVGDAARDEDGGRRALVREAEDERRG